MSGFGWHRCWCDCGGPECVGVSVSVAEVVVSCGCGPLVASARPRSPCMMGRTGPVLPIASDWSSSGRAWSPYMTGHMGPVLPTVISKG